MGHISSQQHPCKISYFYKFICYFKTPSQTCEDLNWFGQPFRPKPGPITVVTRAYRVGSEPVHRAAPNTFPPHPSRSLRAPHIHARVMQYPPLDLHPSVLSLGFGILTRLRSWPLDLNEWTGIVGTSRTSPSESGPLRTSPR